MARRRLVGEQRPRAGDARADRGGEVPLGLGQHPQREPARRRRRGGIGRSLLLIAVAGVLAVALSESLRSKVLDLLFGAEEEFDYSANSSTSASSEPSPAGAAA